MTSSMTGFARAEHESASGNITIELRSVNHRYLDTTIRMPEILRKFENRVRDTLQKKIARGKLECNIRFTPAVNQESIEFDEARAITVIHSLEKITGLMQTPAKLKAETVLQWPGVIGEESPDEKTLQASLDEAILSALETMTVMRQQEGSRLQTIIEQRLEKLITTVKAVRERRVEVIAKVRKKLLDRLESLDFEPDSGRLEQELAFIAQKLDVDEELDRLDSHVEATKETLQRNEAIGRRLDFIMQEFNREANTLSSKSADAETTAASVELKVLIEQMREQVQNIE